MATEAQILEVRNNTNTTTDEYSDIVVGGLIDDSSVNCASATIWRWEYAKLGQDAAKALKKTVAGIENHEYNGIKDQMEYYKDQIAIYEKKCNLDNNVGTVRMFKTERPNVANVITEDQINELNS